MNSIITKQTELHGNYRYLINSIQHFSDIDNLDQRTFAITVHVNKASDLNLIRKLIPLHLNELITDDRYSISNERPALIICDDVEGSRDFNPNLTNPVYPHFHGVLILSKETMVQIKDMDKFITEMENKLLLINEVRHATANNKAVDIKPYHYKNSIFDLASYSTKLMHQAGNTDFNFGVYPYEFDLHNKKNIGLGIQAADNAEKLFEDVLANPSIAFSDRYLKMYGYEIEEIRQAVERRIEETALDASRIGQTIH